MDSQSSSPEPSGLHRAYTQRGSTARQRSINFMPSRQLSLSTLKHRTDPDQNSLLDELLTSEPQDQTPEEQADIIVKEMEQHQLLMEDNPVAEERRREALRDLPKGLTTKRSVREKLSVSVSMRSKHRPISHWKRLKYCLSFASKRARDRLRNFIFSIEPWYEAIRKIEGNFGSAVGSYFYFLRWVVVFDLMLLALLVCFVVAPQVVHDGRVNGTDRGSRGVLDFMSGTGAFENSLLFFGHYHSGNISSNGRLTYNMTSAYFFTLCSLYLVFFAVLCYKTAYSYRVNFIETGGGLRHVYANKVFSGWDFGIATERAALLNHRSIYNELKELLSEHDKKSTTTPICIKLSHYLTNTIVTVLVLSFIGGLEYGLWLLLRVEGVMLNHWELVVSTIVTTVICVCPIVFSLIVRAEFYTPRVGLYVTLARTCLLDNATLFILLFAAINKASNHCWETSFGQETYRLVLLDALFSLIVLPAIEFFRGLVYKINSKEDGLEFNIAYNSLTVIYTQCVLWFGMLFSPLLVVAVVLKFLCLFYVKRALAFYACVPARKVWRAAQTQTVMYMLVTVSSFVTLFGLGSIVLKSSSQECGPFRQYEFVYQTVTEGLLSLSERDTLRSMLVFITRPGVIAFVMLFLCVAVYYIRAKSQAQQSMVNILRQMLVLEAKDKDFLLTAISKVSNGEWLYNKGDILPPDSHTWKYLHDNNVRKPSNADYHFDASRINHSALESSRINSSLPECSRPKSFSRDLMSNCYGKERPESLVREDGETDSSFSWQGSNTNLRDSIFESGSKKWV